MTPRRPAALILGTVLLVLLAGLLVACGGGSDEQVESPPRDTTTTSGVDLNVYFLRNGKVGTAHRRVPPTRAVARAALEQLIAGPDAIEGAAGMTTVIRPETTITRLDIADGVATVSLSPDFGRGYNDVTAQQATAQVVYTLTQFPTVEEVRIGSAGTTGPPLGRDDLRAVTPLVLLESVAPGDVVTSPVVVAGESNTFEATVRIRILGADGSVLADTFTTATSGTGTWGTFAAKVPFAKGSNPTGKVVVFWDSPKDGSPQDVTEVPVRFA